MDRREGAPDLAWCAKACAASLHGASRAFERVDTDSRNAGIDALFIALRGERVDGHDFIPQAMGNGCRCFLVSASWYEKNGAAFGSEASFLPVADPLSALQAIAKAWRIHCGQPNPRREGALLKIGITGSSGKTTVKELVANIMEAFKLTVRNPGNLNSEIGLPASILLMRPWHEAAVFEMGINRMGEMDILADIFEPDCAVITNIGTAHIGLLGGSRESIAAQKKIITSRFSGSQSLFVWEEDDLRDFLLQGIDGKGYAFGPRSTDGFEGARPLGLDGWALRYEGAEIRFALPGSHNLLDALAAIRVARHCGADAQAVKKGLEKAVPLFGRSEILRGEITVVNDCYNANAESVVAAVEFCDAVDCAGRKIYVLGSMKELGESAKAAHERVGYAAYRSKAATVMFYGEEARYAYEAAREAPGSLPGRFLHFNDYGQLSRALAEEAKPGDIVLIKASRSMALERLAEQICAKGASHVS